MPTATDAPTFHADVVAALAELSEIVADETADTGQYRYKYATLAGIMRAVRPILAKHRLAVTQQVAGQDGDYLTLSTALVHTTGATWESGFIRAKQPAAPQQIGSLVSYLRRYQLVALLGLAIEDDDARSAQPPPRAVVTRPARSQPAATLSDPARRRIMALFGELDLNGEDKRAHRLRLTSEIVGRPLETTNEVTPGEASHLMEELEAMVEDRRRQLDPDGY